MVYCSSNSAWASSSLKDLILVLTGRVAGLTSASGEGKEAFRSMPVYTRLAWRVSIPYNCFISRTLNMGQSKLNTIPDGLMELYKERKISSAALAEQVGMNASYLRRAIARSPVEKKLPKKPLLEARKAFRASIADKNVTEIMQLAFVSKRTAQRLRAKFKKSDTLAPKAQNPNESVDIPH